MTIDGVWRVEYSAAHGSGDVVLTLRGGRLAGIDTGGGVANGTYSAQPNGAIRINADWQASASTSFVPVQTGLPLPPGSVFKVDTTLPPNFGNGAPIPVNTELGPVNARFQKLCPI